MKVLVERISPEESTKLVDALRKNSEDASAKLRQDIHLLSHLPPSPVRWLKACSAFTDFLRTYPSDDFYKLDCLLAAMARLLETPLSAADTDFRFSPALMAEMATAYELLQVASDGRVLRRYDKAISTLNILFDVIDPENVRFRGHLLDQLLRADTGDPLADFAEAPLTDDEVLTVRSLRQEGEALLAKFRKSVPLTDGLKEPDLGNKDECKRFLRETYSLLRDRMNDTIHSETDAVTYILLEARKDDPYYELCLIARKIKDSHHWERSTFTTYCKEKSPTPKGLKSAAKGRAKKRQVARDLQGL